MNNIDIRKSIVQAKFDENAGKTLESEIILTSIILGLITKSWWVFGGILLGLTAGLISKKVAFIICIAFSICWGFIGFFIGTLFSSTSASIVLAVIGLLGGFGANLSGIKWIRDLHD